MAKANGKSVDELSRALARLSKIMASEDWMVTSPAAEALIAAGASVRLAFSRALEAAGEAGGPSDGSRLGVGERFVVPINAIADAAERQMAADAVKRAARGPRRR